ncbi:MAG: glycosyltransferase family 4 protein [Gammaproteobacteria bacterium]|nr:glycosyltransferase family 4 protein [Gammaproteobacteria bacterium]
MNTPRSGRQLVLLIAEHAYFLSHRLALAEAAVRQGYEVCVFTRVPAGETPAPRAGVNVIPVPIRRSFGNPLADLALVATLTREWRRLRPAIVHNVSVKLCVLGSIAAWLAGVPGVVNAFTGLGYAFRSRGPLAALLRAVVTPILGLGARRRGTWALFQNGDDLEYCRRRGLVNYSRSIVIEGSGVDLRRFQPAPEQGGEPRILFAARLLWDKGIGEFVEAARMLRGRGVRARFTAVGDPDPDNPSCVDEPTLAAWRSEGIVEWPGYQEDMAAWMNRAHVFCLPSHHEGLPKVLLEAGACALPIVASDIPGCRAVVEPGVNGLLVPVGDAASLAAALEKLVQDGGMRSEMGRMGRHIVEERFGVETINGKILALYERVQGRLAAPDRVSA